MLSVILNKAVIRPTTNPFETITISPLYYGKDSTFIVQTKAAALQIKFYLSNDLYQDKEIYSGLFAKSGTHYITYNNEFTRGTNQLYISYRSVTTWTSSEAVTLTPSSDKHRYLYDNQSFNSTSKVNVLSYSTMKWTGHYMNYSFTNFDGLYMPDYYHKIRLNDFVIKIAGDDRKLFTCNPLLVINNVDGVFNDITTAESVEFPLTLIRTDEGFTFELKDILYVHKETLKLSKTAKSGYVQTKHIFLPRNEMRNQDKYRAYFALQNFGIDRDLVKHNFELRALKNIIGDCQNSEYCIQRL